MKKVFFPPEYSRHALTIEEAFAIISCPIVHVNSYTKKENEPSDHYHSRFNEAIKVVENALDSLIGGKDGQV